MFATSEGALVRLAKRALLNESETTLGPAIGCWRERACCTNSLGVA